MSANGRLSASELAPIGGGLYLSRQAAAQFNAMNAEARRRFGQSITVRAAYRTYATQVYFWHLYRSGGGNLAAYPGTSNHGLGIAVDLASTRSRWIVDQIGYPYGWSKRLSDAPSEWWHVRWTASIVTKRPAPVAAPLRYRATGARVQTLQQRLRALGFKSVPARGKPGYGFFGRSTLSAIKRFQKAHHLTADGVVGAKTTAALKAAVK